MRLYLVRHATAKDGTPDAARPLNKAGRREVKRVGKRLRKMGLDRFEIWYSPLKRAAQTAKGLAKALGLKKKLKEFKGLSPGQPTLALRKQLAAMDQDLMVVGHQPFMGRLTSELLSGEEGADFVDFPKGGVACLEKDGKTGSWNLGWLLDPDILG